MRPEQKTELQSSQHLSAQARLSRFFDARRGKMFGVAEVVALAGSCFVLALVMFSYLYFVAPARARLATLDGDRKQTLNNLETLDKVVNREQSTSQNVDQVASSLNAFETKYLLRPDQGRLDLYDELNQLIVKNGVRNTSGPTYTSLDSNDAKSGAGKTVATKWQSFYPGLAVMVTVEGEYQNVRRFIRDVERSRQFVVINEVELQRARQGSSPVAAEGSGSRGSLITLQLNMTTYFQRPGASPQDQ